jgi:putative sugar O-methyltransferase
MSFRRRFLSLANTALHKTGLHVLPVYEFERMQTVYRGPRWEPPPIDEASRAWLNLTNPRLAELRRRYARHPAAAHAQWNEDNVLRYLELTQFRGDNHYLHQVRESPSPEAYFVTAYHVRDHDRLGLFGRLREDGLFGAYTLTFDNDYVISRDLLDSINEINFIYRRLNRSTDQPVRVLDIGAGYGRLAHRIAEAFPAAHATCTDAVPLSTFLSEFYLRFRGVDKQANVVALDEVETVLTGEQFDVVTNIHSFPECRMPAIEWWLSFIAKLDVHRMMIVPNAPDRLLSTESDGTHQDFSGLIERFGWRLTHKEPIYGASEVARAHAIYPGSCFHWFERG